jgi:hypothetical protein
MQPSELAFFTTRELIEELMSRKTFLGVVVHSESELKSDRWADEQVFNVHLNENLDAARASRLLDVVAGYMDRNYCE